MPAIIDPNDSPGFVAVGAASAQHTKVMQDGSMYLLASSTAAWFAIGSNPTASKAAGSAFISATTPVVILCRAPNTKVALIQDAAGGNSSLTKIT